MRLLDWQRRPVRVLAAAIGGRDELGASITALLLEHARRSDEDGATPPRG